MERWTQYKWQNYTHTQMKERDWYLTFGKIDFSNTTMVRAVQCKPWRLPGVRVYRAPRLYNSYIHWGGFHIEMNVSKDFFSFVRSYVGSFAWKWARLKCDGRNGYGMPIFMRQNTKKEKNRMRTQITYMDLWMYTFAWLYRYMSIASHARR